MFTRGCLFPTFSGPYVIRLQQCHSPNPMLAAQHFASSSCSRLGLSGIKRLLFCGDETFLEIFMYIFIAQLDLYENRVAANLLVKLFFELLFSKMLLLGPERFQPPSKCQLGSSSHAGWNTKKYLRLIKIGGVAFLKTLHTFWDEVRICIGCGVVCQRQPGQEAVNFFGQDLHLSHKQRWVRSGNPTTTKFIQSHDTRLQYLLSQNINAHCCKEKCIYIYIYIYILQYYRILYKCSSSTFFSTSCWGLLW